MSISQISTLSTPPNRSDPATFDDRADTFLGELPGWGAELNTMGSEMNTLASDVSADAFLAEAARDAAVAVVDASAWAQGSPYVTGDTVYADNGHTYRAIASSTAKNPPENIGTYWTCLTEGPSVVYVYDLGNGGTESIPEIIGTSVRIVIDNPFPGYEIFVEAQIRPTGSNWGPSGWIYSDGGQGVAAHVFSDDRIVVQSGSKKVAAASRDSGSPHALASGLYEVLCRVKVMKIAKVGE